MRRAPVHILTEGRRVALYLRRSTNEELQADSLDIQEEILRTAAAKLGDQVVAVFRESASGRDANGRPEFRRLIEVVVSGAAEFDAVFVRDISRWGRFDNIDESAYYDFLCFRHAVQVVYVEESFGSDQSPYASLMKSMKRVLAAEYSREKSRIVSHGKKRTAERGFHSGGPPPYGMKRVLVESTGTFQQDLPKGVHKVVSCLKTKLASAMDETTRTVVRIFEAFVTRRLRPGAIAKELNRANIPSPGGRTWSVATITDMLQNARYAGVGTLRTSDITIAVENAYEALISRDVFEQAQGRLTDLRRADFTTRSRLIREARAAQDRWGHLPGSLLHEIAGTARNEPYRARLAETILENEFAVSIARAREHVLQVLSEAFAIDDRGSHVTLNAQLRVGFVVGWRRVDLVSAPVVFAFSGAEVDDYVICLGCEAEPEFRVVIRCLAAGEAIRASGAQRIIRHATSRKRTRLLADAGTDGSLIRRLRRAVWTTPQIARRAVRNAAQPLDTMSFAKIGRQLRWPTAAVRRAYYELRAAGEPLPEERTVVRKSAEAAPTSKRHRRLLRAVCSKCGTERDVWPCVAAKMKGGLAAHCHACAMAKGREATYRRNHESRGARQAKYAFLHSIALMVLQVMRARPEYERPTVWSIARRRFATVRWKSRSDGLFHRLSLDCTESFIDRCTATPHEVPCASLADAILDRRTWTGGHSDKRSDHVWFCRLS